MSFEQDATKSIQQFNSFTAPAIKKALGAKKIISTEQHKNEIEKFLDQEAGIDAFIVIEGNTIYPVACRLQFGKCYESFSIRRSRPSGAITEHSKLVEAFRTKGLMPKYHFQGFVDANEQTAIVATTETIELLKYVEKHQKQWRTAPSGETFYYCPWRELYEVQIYLVNVKGQIEDITRLYKKNNVT